MNDALIRREDRGVYHPAVEEVDPVTEEPTGNIIPAYHDPADGIFDNWIAQLNDAQGSIVKTVAAKTGTHGVTPEKPMAVGQTIDEIEYDPYGRSRRHFLGDFNHDGVYGVDDIVQGAGQTDAYFAGSPSADQDDNGLVETTDILTFLNDWFRGADGPADTVSNAYTDNPYGYCGYYFDVETLGINGPDTGAFYHVRHRVYDPASGRWLTRDPAGFVDGVNLYEYVGARALRGHDPLGLFSLAQYTHDFTEGVKEVYESWTEPGLKGRLIDGAKEVVSPETEIGRTTRRAAVTAVVAAATAGVSAAAMGAGAATVTGGVVVGGVSAGVSNAVDQGMQINDGDRDDFSVTELAVNIAVGGIVGGVANKFLAYFKAGRTLSTSSGSTAEVAYPPNRGFYGKPVKQTLSPGTVVDRYGGPKGTFVSPKGTPAPARSLAPGAENRPLNTYEVAKPIEVDAGPVAPWFDKPGKGIQYELPAPVQELLDSGHLKHVSCTP